MFLELKELPFSQWWDNNTLYLSLGTLDTQSQNHESIMCRIIQKHYLSSFSSSAVHILFSAFLQGRVMRTRTLCALSGGWQNQKSIPGLTNCMVQTLFQLSVAFPRTQQNYKGHLGLIQPINLADKRQVICARLPHVHFLLILLNNLETCSINIPYLSQLIGAFEKFTTPPKG